VSRASVIDVTEEAAAVTTRTVVPVRFPRARVRGWPMRGALLIVVIAPMVFVGIVAYRGDRRDARAQRHAHVTSRRRRF
jgi:hypothetical protein